MHSLSMVGIIFFLSVGVVWTQGPQQSWDHLQTLRTGENIQVVDQGLRSHQGTFLSVSAETITFRVEQNEVTLMEYRRGRITQKYCRWGRPARLADSSFRRI
jgi:hypothetical protein